MSFCPVPGSWCSPAICDTNAKCLLSGGKFQCVCEEGFRGDGEHCIPINPCDTNNGGCPVESAACEFTSPGKVSNESKSESETNVEFSADYCYVSFVCVFLSSRNVCVCLEWNHLIRPRAAHKSRPAHRVHAMSAPAARPTQTARPGLSRSFPHDNMTKATFTSFNDTIMTERISRNLSKSI